jgi:hypothetical protein
MYRTVRWPDGGLVYSKNALICMSGGVTGRQASSRDGQARRYYAGNAGFAHFGIASGSGKFVRSQR